jgi:hypothetical protein
MQEGHSPALAIFQTPVVDTGVESVEWVGFRPVSQLAGGGPIEFNIPGHSTSYIDLKRTRLHIKLRLLKADGSPVGDQNLVSLVNLPLQSMWSQVDVALQNQVVSPNIGNNYAYKSMIDVLLQNEEDPKLTQLQSQLYFMDSHGYMDDPDPSGNNNGLLKRWEFTKEGAAVDMEGNLFIDIFNQDRYLLNGVHLGVKLWPHKAAFALMSGEADADYAIDITDAVLKLCLVKVSPGIVIGHGEALQNSPAIYPFTRTDIRTFAVGTGQYDVTIENIWQGVIPTTAIVAIVASEAYSGNLKRNPFAFANWDLSSIGMFVQGRPVPSHPMQLNYDKGNYIEAYVSMFTGTGKYGTNAGNYIEREQFPEGYAIYVLDIEGKEGSTEHSYLKRGHTRLELRFAKPLPEPVTVIVYGTFPAVLEIDQSRTVRL